MKKLTNLRPSALHYNSKKNHIDSAGKQEQGNTLVTKIVLSLFFLLFFCLAVFAIYGQTKETFVKKIYLQSGIGGTTYNGFNADLGIQAILKNNWSTTLSFHQVDDMTPKNQPSDYTAETGIVLFFLPYSDQVTSKMNVYSLTAGKFFPAGRKLWFTTEAGLSVVNGEKVTYKHIDNSSDYTSDALYLLFGTMQTSSSNYSTNTESKTVVGGMLRADANWAFSSFMGLGAGVFANFNSIQSPIGYNIKLTIGWMNRGKK